MWSKAFKTELIKPVSPLYFNDKERTSALISLCSLLNILLPESQPNKKIYEIFDNLINSLNLDNWIILYIFFEINLIKELGYDVNLSSYNEINDEPTNIKKINDKFTELLSREKPILETLLVRDKNNLLKSLLKLKNTKNIINKDKK